MLIKMMLLSAILIFALFSGCSTPTSPTSQPEQSDRPSRESTPARAAESAPEPIEPVFDIYYIDRLVTIEKDYGADGGLSHAGKYRPTVPTVKWFSAPHLVHPSDSGIIVEFRTVESDFEILDDGRGGLQFETQQTIYYIAMEFPEIYQLNHIHVGLSQEQFTLLENKTVYWNRFMFDVDSQSLLYRGFNPILSWSGLYIPSEMAHWFQNHLGENLLVGESNLRITTPAGVFDDCIGIINHSQRLITYYAAEYGEILTMSWGRGVEEVLSVLVYLMYIDPRAE